LTVLWPVVRKATVPCIEGRAAIQSRRLQSAGGARTRLVREWLRQNNLLRVCDHDYVPGSGGHSKHPELLQVRPSTAWRRQIARMAT
jgi:hypothetical protein